MFPRDDAGAAATGAGLLAAGFLAALLAGSACFGAGTGLVAVVFFADCFAVFLPVFLAAVFFAAFFAAGFFGFLAFFTTRFFVFARFLAADAVAARPCFAFRFLEFFSAAVATTDS